MVGMLILFAAALSASAQAPSASKPALTRDMPSKRDWTVRVEVRFHPIQPRVSDRRRIPPTPRFFFQELDFVFPLIPGSSMHTAYPERATGELRVENRVLDQTPDVTAGYQSLCSMGTWRARSIDTHQLYFIGEFPTTCYETRIDEAAARRYTWPVSPWSADMALCLEPQLFVESTDPDVVDLVRSWIGPTPRQTPPYELAKILAGKCVEHVHPTGWIIDTRSRGIAAGDNRASIITGFRVNGAAHAAREKNGSPLDLACLLTAAYRAAGIPARLVIGFDIEASNRLKSPVLRSWTEFFLAREPAWAGAAQTASNPLAPAIRPEDGEWIPVDVFRQREFSSRAPPIDRPWRYFGHNEEFDFVVPIAFHWVPPADVVTTGPPGMWGWQGRPANAIADVEMKFLAFETPNRGGEQGRK